MGICCLLLTAFSAPHPQGIRHHYRSTESDTWICVCARQMALLERLW
jgi:hypothetical protein